MVITSLIFPPKQDLFLFFVNHLHTKQHGNEVQAYYACFCVHVSMANVRTPKGEEKAKKKGKKKKLEFPNSIKGNAWIMKI